jgi:hypothetical protein
MLSFKARLVATVGAAFLAMVFALPASPAMASAKSCVPEPGGHLQTCSYVNGSGLHINYLQGSVFNEIGAITADNVHIELTKVINGHTYFIKNCAQTNINPGQTIYCTWSPNAPESAGNYCATSWQLQPGGGYLSRGTACVGVHR